MAHWLIYRWMKFWVKKDFKCPRQIYRFRSTLIDWVRFLKKNNHSRLVLVNIEPVIRVLEKVGNIS